MFLHSKITATDLTWQMDTAHSPPEGLEKSIMRYLTMNATEATVLAQNGSYDQIHLTWPFLMATCDDLT